jgi:hypothetical protein
MHLLFLIIFMFSVCFLPQVQNKIHNAKFYVDVDDTSKTLKKKVHDLLFYFITQNTVHLQSKKHTYFYKYCSNMLSYFYV